LAQYTASLNLYTDTDTDTDTLLNIMQQTCTKIMQMKTNTMQ